MRFISGLATTQKTPYQPSRRACHPFSHPAVPTHPRPRTLEHSSCKRIRLPRFLGPSRSLKPVSKVSNDALYFRSRDNPGNPVPAKQKSLTHTYQPKNSIYIPQTSKFRTLLLQKNPIPPRFLGPSRSLKPISKVFNDALYFRSRDNPGNPVPAKQKSLTHKYQPKNSIYTPQTFVTKMDLSVCPQ